MNMDPNPQSMYYNQVNIGFEFLGIWVFFFDLLCKTFDLLKIEKDQQIFNNAFLDLFFYKKYWAPDL